MASIVRQKPPMWFWIVSVVLLLWAAVGLFAFYAHVTIDDQALAAMSAYDRDYYKALPGWFDAVFAVATIPALAGAACLLMRSKLARPLYIVSLVGVILQFGYVFGGTDMIAVKGVATAVSFPAIIFLLGVFQLWLATIAIGRGWLR